MEEDEIMQRAYALAEEKLGLDYDSLSQDEMLQIFRQAEDEYYSGLIDAAELKMEVFRE
jgi:hypothetical protein